MTLFSHDTRAATVGEDGLVRLWDVRAQRELVTQGGHLDRVTALAFTSDGQKLISGGLDGWVRIWSLKTKRSVRAFVAHRKGVFGLAISKDQRSLFTGAQRKIARWSLATQTREQIFQRGAVYKPTNFKLSEDARSLAVRSAGRGKGNGSNKWIDLTHDQPIGLVSAGLKYRVGVPFFDGKRALFLKGQKDRTLIIAPQDPSAPITLQGPFEQNVFSEDGALLALKRADGIHLFETQTGRALGLLTTGDQVPLCFSKDRRWMVVEDGAHLAIIELETRRTLARWPSPGPVHVAVLSWDEQTLAAASDDSTIWLYPLDPFLARP